VSRRGWHAALLLAVCSPFCSPFCSPAWGQVDRVFWDDPTLAHAVRDADLIVLAKAGKVATNGAAYRVERTLKGPKRDGELLAITGLHHPELRDRPPVSQGDHAYLLLRGEAEGEGFSLPTPTFGRFVLREGQVVLSFGGSDTFVRLRVPAARFEAIVGGFVTGKAPALVSWCREVVRGDEPAGEELYQALRVLSWLGTSGDAASAARILKNERYGGAEHERVRMAAARVLGRTGGERGARTLVALAVPGKVRPAVVSVALDQVPVALGDHPPQRAVRAVCHELARLTPKLRTKPIRYGQADDPRRNFVDAPLMACLKSIARLGSSAGVGPALRALEREDFEAIQAGLVYFERLKDPAHAADIAERMRPAGHRDVFVNRAFGASLQLLTGQRLGDDRRAWLAWCREQTESNEAVGPPRPGGGK
jgi:hypothetical protein